MPELDVVQARAARWDAIVRSRRTLVQALAFDVAAAVVVAMLTAVGTVEFTATWIKGLGLLLVKSAVTAVLSGLARMFAPPSPP